MEAHSLGFLSPRQMEDSMIIINSTTWNSSKRGSCRHIRPNGICEILMIYDAIYCPQVFERIVCAEPAAAAIPSISANAKGFPCHIP